LRNGEITRGHSHRRRRSSRVIAEALETRALLSVVGQLVSPAADSKTNIDRGYVDVAWVDSTGTGLRANTLDNKDITIANVTVRAPTQVSPGVWRYAYTGSLAPGNVFVNFVAGQVKNQANESNPGGGASFLYDVYGPNIFSQWPAVTSAYAGDLTEVQLSFTERIDLASFNLADDVKLIGPGGVDASSAVIGHVWYGTNNDILRVDIVPPNVGGQYQLVVGPNLTDVAGNLMDQDKDGVKGEATQDAFVHNLTVTPLVQFYQENLDANPGWTIDPGGQWAFGQPSGGGGTLAGNPDPTSGHTGSNVYGVNLSGDYRVGVENDFGVTSTAIDVSGYKHIRVGFWRWLNTGDNSQTQQRVFYSIDKQNWQFAWSNDQIASPITDSGWQYVEYQLSLLADQQPALYLRWEHRSISNAAQPYSGWNIDGIILRGAEVAVSAPVGAPDLLPGSDTGIADDDNITRRNNRFGDPASPLSFRVPNTTPGATVRVYMDNAPFAQATATGAETIVTSSGTSQISDGPHVFTARQAEPGLDFSPASPGLSVTIDSVAPTITVSPRLTADLTPAVYGPTPTGGAVQVKATVNGVTYDAIINSIQWVVLDDQVGPLNAGLYDVQAQAVDAAGNIGVDSTLDELTIQPFPPVIINEPASTAGLSNTISWQPTGGATHYWVEYDTSSNFSSPDGNSGWIPATPNPSHTFSGLVDGVTYYYRVKAAGYTSGRTSSWSQTASSEFKTGTLANVNIKTSGNVTLNPMPALFADDFEDGNDNGWIETDESYLDEILTTPTPAAGGGDYSLSLWGNVGSYYHPLPSLRPARVDFNVRAPQIGYVGYFVLEGATDLNRAVFFYMQTDGTMGVFDGTTMHATPYEANRWYKISFLIDWNTKRVSYLVDGQTIATNIAFREDADNFQTLRLYNHIGSFDPKAHYDEISLSGSATPQFQSAGSVTSAPITPAQLSRWSTLSFTKNTPAGTAVTVDVLNSAGAVLASNVASGTDLSTLGVTASSIRLRANLSTTNPAVTPSLLDWNVVWKTSPDLYMSGGFSDVTYSRQDATAPTMNFNVSLDPMPSSWQWLQIEFNEPVTGVTLDDFTLTRDGGPNLLSSANAVTTLNFQTWKIQDTSAITDRVGRYVLTYTPSGIADQAGNAAVQGRTFAWLKNVVTGRAFGLETDDVIVVRRNAANAALAEISLNGDAYTVNLVNFAAYGSTPLEIQGHHGDDTVTLDFSNGSFAPAGGIVAIGDNFANWQDRLVIKGTAGDDVIEFRNDAARGKHFLIGGAAAGGGSPVIVAYDAFYDRRFDGGAGNDSLTMRGDFTFVEDFGTATANLTLNVENGARLLFAESQTLAALNVNDGVAELNLNGRHTLKTRALSVLAAGVLEMQNNDLVVDYTGASAIGTWNGNAYGGITGLIAAGRIRSTPALENAQGTTTLGIGEAADVFSLGAGETTLWNFQTVDATSVVVKYTYAGDANLDGVIDGADYGTLDNWYQFPGTAGFANGDVNYDGVIDGADYGTLDNSIQLQGAPL